MKCKRVLKFAALAAAVAAALAALFSCSAFGGGNTLTVMGRKSDMEKSYMKRIFDRYEEATGNRLDIIGIEDAEFEETAEERFEKGELPDVFLHFNNSDLERFDVDENFYYMNGEGWVGELTDSARDYCLDGEGNILGLPFWESSVSGCYYNKTLLEELGLRPAATQKEFDMLCQALADVGRTPILWPADGCTWMFQFGLDPIFADDNDLLDDLNEGRTSYAEIDAVRDMAEWIGSAAKKGWFGDGFLRQGWGDIGPKLASGEAVMTFIWDTWFYTDFEAGKYSVDDFALMPVFMNTAEGGTFEGGNLNMMMVNKNSARLDEALGFLDFCADPENYNAAFDGISTVSAFVGQTTNIQSVMVTDAAASIAKRERVSTAASKIAGYSADDVAAAFDSLFRGKTDAEGCVEKMDEYRLANVKKQDGR